MTHIGYRLERHNAHMAAVRAIQRRHQLQRVESVLARHEAWRRTGVQLEGDAESVAALIDMRDDLIAEMTATGQQP